MSTRNYFKDFHEIPVRKFGHRYFINDNCDIITIEKDKTGYDLIYQFNKNTPFKLIELMNFQDNEKVYLKPIDLYMITYFGFLPFEIKYRFKEDPTTYYYDIPSLDTINDDLIMLEDIEFRKSNLIKHGNIFISENGCIFDRISSSIKRHRYKDKIYNYQTYSKFKIHQLVYDAWIGPIDPELEIHHKDNNDWNNNASNLIQVSRSEHMILHNNTIYSDEVITQICELMSSGISIVDASKSLNVPYNLARDLRAKCRHKSISLQYDFPEVINNGASSKSDNDIHEICKLLVNRELNNSEIGKIYGLNKYTIQDIRMGNSWKRISDQYGFVREADLGSLKNTKLTDINDYKPHNQSISIDQVKDIWHRLQNGESLISVSRNTGISYSIIKKIKYRTRWRKVTDLLGPLPDDLKNIVQK